MNADFPFTQPPAPFPPLVNISLSFGTPFTDLPFLDPAPCDDSPFSLPTFAFQAAENQEAEDQPESKDNFLEKETYFHTASPASDRLESEASPSPGFSPMDLSESMQPLFVTPNCLTFKSKTSPPCSAPPSSQQPGLQGRLDDTLRGLHLPGALPVARPPPATPPKTFRSQNSKKKNNPNSCTCSKSKCLRLHCKCFGKLGMCGPECVCTNCLNRPEFADARNFVIEKTKMIFPQAFESRITVIGEGKEKVNAVGCKCSKGCKKKYCECVKAGVDCSVICKCVECANGYRCFDKHTVKKIFKMPVRRKHKLVFYGDGEKASEKEGEESQKSQNVIEFAVYRKKKKDF